MTDPIAPRSSSPDDAASRARAAAVMPHVLAVRQGHGANCSSIGSVIDTLFVSAVLGGVVLAAIAAAMGSEETKVHGEGAGGPSGPEGEREGEGEGEEEKAKPPVDNGSKAGASSEERS